MKANDWLISSVELLTSCDIPTARLDCLVLLEDITGKTRAFLLAHPEFVLNPTQIQTLNEKVKQRTKHIPLAYIRGKTEFYGREFKVNASVLEPRPESETIIDLLLKLPNPKQIIDIGTGSGALAITAKLERPSTHVTATDIDPACLEVVRTNSELHGVELTVAQGDLLTPIDKNDLANSVILANLPYVPDEHALNDAAMNEPRLAIFGGEDGLDKYRELFQQAAETQNARPRHIITESLPFQHRQLAAIATRTGYELQTTSDFVQCFTVQEQLQASQ